MSRSKRFQIGIVLTAVAAGVAAVAAGRISPPAPPASPGLAASPGRAASRAATPIAGGQLLRSTERARILAAVVDHEPMARGTTVRLAVQVEVAAGMHVNANPPSEEWLIPVQASVAGVDGVRVMEAFYPEAKSRRFPYAEQPFRVYEGTFIVGLTLAVAGDLPAGGRQLEVILDYQACDDDACFAPAQTSTKVPVMVVSDPADAVEISSPVLERAPFPR